MTVKKDAENGHFFYNFITFKITICNYYLILYGIDSFIGKPLFKYVFTGTSEISAQVKELTIFLHTPSEAPIKQHVYYYFLQEILDETYSDLP